ncbi:CDGSH iron-sulfur domain-containing protein [Candidatus Woesearchaeota archaeon]|nr:CDGSH iron-sulfur domain-containing protein [Candidatus Woesearchaeota archaeon]
MARIVKQEAQGPTEVKPGEKSAWICMCGLSGNKPFCDGSHKKTKDEVPGKIYAYGSDGSRVELQ